jgi:hypothetical protein
LWLRGPSKQLDGLIKLRSSLLCPQRINLPSQDRKKKTCLRSSATLCPCGVNKQLDANIKPQHGHCSLEN